MQQLTVFNMLFAFVFSTRRSRVLLHALEGTCVAAKARRPLTADFLHPYFACAFTLSEGGGSSKSRRVSFRVGGGAAKKHSYVAGVANLPLPKNVATDRRLPFYHSGDYVLDT